MARFTRAALTSAILLMIATAQSGCITGKTFEGARLDERATDIHSVCRTGDVVRIRYQASVTREFGEVISRHERAAEIPVANLEEHPRRNVDELEVLPIDSTSTASREECLPIAARVEGLGASRDGTWVSEHAGSNESVLEIPAGALHRDRTAAWVWPLVPITVALDVVTTPAFFLVGVPYMASGD